MKKSFAGVFGLRGISAESHNGVLEDRVSSVLGDGVWWADFSGGAG
ncbi:hypothetical protein RISK_004832 [Rhodopirellula islandica]|uniref:Uncharacterized protein n=1 Tax=Rhodopirellula islandica TaxID=595434 RepID=A0A0J1B9C5_RHOIS|nr:hypothetical protein RISK_004832 [Rhodopirellula islandica]